MRSRRTLRVILNGKSRLAFYAYTFDRAVIQVDMCYFDMPGFLNRFGIHAKTMVLRSDLAAARHEIFDGVIEPAMTVVKFESRHPIGQRE